METGFRMAQIQTQRVHSRSSQKISANASLPDLDGAMKLWVKL
jgi:hypothetical protein